MNDNQLEVALRETSAIVTALELALKVLIITYPDRDQLAHVWRIMLPEQIDHFMQQPAYESVGQRETLHKKLADIGEFIEMELPGDECEVPE